MTDARALRERVAEAIHDGLGGNGWAYANYGGDELVTEADKLAKAASAVIDLVLEQAEKAIKETKTKSRAIAAIRALKNKTENAT